MKIACLQHVPFEGPAITGTWAAARGYPLVITRLFAGDPLPSTTSVDFLLILGGPMSANAEDHFEWLCLEKRFIAACIEQGKHVLGICLGAQLVAAAMGARVYPNAEREIGWFPVRRTAAADRHRVFSELPRRFPAFHWHGETFDLPRDATDLAESDACRHQAFGVGDRVLGLQFHLESTPESVDALIQHCPADLAPGRFVQDARAMRAAHDHFHDSNHLMTALLDHFTAGVEGR